MTIHGYRETGTKFWKLLHSMPSSTEYNKKTLARQNVYLREYRRAIPPSKLISELLKYSSKTRIYVVSGDRIINVTDVIEEDITPVYEKYLKNKLEEIERKIEINKFSRRDGFELLAIREKLNKRPVKSLQKKYFEIIEKLFKKLPAEEIKEGEFIELGENILIRKSKDKFEIIVI